MTEQFQRTPNAATASMRRAPFTAPAAPAGRARPGNPRQHPAGGTGTDQRALRPDGDESALRRDGDESALRRDGGDESGPLRGGDRLPLPGGAEALPLLRARCTALARRYGVPGAQLAIARRGATVAFELGELEYRGGRPVTRESAFPIGSITKTVTAAVALALVADGDLELDAPVGEFVPALDRLGDDVTLRRLLSHTAGLSGGPDSDEVGAASPVRYLTDHHGDLVTAPGRGFSYSNAGYVAVGALISEVTGMSWSEAVATIALAPLRVVPTFVGAGDWHAPNRAVATGHASSLPAERRGGRDSHFGNDGHFGRVGPQPRVVRQSLAPAEAAAGALAMSAADLARLGAALIDPAGSALLPAGYAAQMRDPQPGADPFGLADGWGLGLALFDRPDGNGRWVGHDGNGFGTACYLRVDPVDGWVVAFTSNATTGAALWHELGAQLRLAGIPLPTGPEPVEDLPARAVPSGCTGRYANGSVEFTVAVRNGQALLGVDDAAPVPLTFHDDLTFSVPDPQTRRAVLGGRFTRDPATGRIDGLQIAGRLARRNQHPYESRSSRIA